MLEILSFSSLEKVHDEQINSNNGGEKKVFAKQKKLLRQQQLS